ncbi:MAG: peptidylprolyl isomerase [Planctomycetia bacterium]|nr:peptidylprolyl isomerase [Planctomycetia bacterium]
MKKILERTAWMGLFVVILSMHLVAAEETAAQPAAKPAPVTAGTSRAVMKVMAIVNGEEISRQQLTSQCLKDYGREVLERMISRYIVEQACQKAKLEITEDELRAEVETTAKRFGVPTDQYLSLLERERGIPARQYIADIIWPTVAIRKLAGKATSPTEEELQIEYERRYGEAIQGRLIATKTKEEAEKIRTEATKCKTPEEFGKLAQKYSTDPYTASLGGVVPPIRRHLNPKNFEDTVFALKNGEISAPIQVGDQYVLILCEEHIPTDKNLTLDKVRGELEVILSQAKTAEVGRKLSQQLLQNANVELIIGDPVKSSQRPGVAGIIDGKVVSTAVLGEECLVRYGKEALKGLINRALINQACKKAKIEITEKDIDDEIARLALESLPPKADGSADVKQWMDNVLKQFGATADRYREDVILPSLQMQRLAEGRFEITDEDLQRSYESNFGTKVRCRAIVLNDLRTAQRVWADAREQGTEDSFIELARKFSTEAGSRANGGEVPPIARYGGQPELEKAAFDLKPGEMSGIIQAENVFVILLCTGHTEPIGVTFDEVKELIHKDVKMKKMQIAIGETFQELKDKATVENYLEGTFESPQQKKPTLSDDAPDGSTAPARPVK